MLAPLSESTLARFHSKRDLVPLQPHLPSRQTPLDSFGWNEGDALGRGWQGAYDPSPGPVPSLPGVISIAAGSRHAAAVTADGPAVGRHLRSLVGDADSSDLNLLAPDAALRNAPGAYVLMDIFRRTFLQSLVTCDYAVISLCHVVRTRTSRVVQRQCWYERRHCACY